jgi:hypothetical protein
MGPGPTAIKELTWVGLVAKVINDNPLTTRRVIVTTRGVIWTSAEPAPAARTAGRGRPLVPVVRPGPDGRPGYCFQGAARGLGTKKSRDLDESRVSPLATDLG